MHRIDGKTGQGALKTSIREERSCRIIIIWFQFLTAVNDLLVCSYQRSSICSI